jgi:hypothetical protein
LINKSITQLKIDLLNLELLSKSLALYHRVIQFNVCVAELSITEQLGQKQELESCKLNETKEKKKTRYPEKHTSCLLINNSKRSVRTFFILCHFAKGLIISRWLMMKVGFTQVSSKKCPTSFNNRKNNIKRWSTNYHKLK